MGDNDSDTSGLPPSEDVSSDTTIKPNQNSPERETNISQDSNPGGGTSTLPNIPPSENISLQGNNSELKSEGCTSPPDDADNKKIARDPSPENLEESFSYLNYSSSELLEYSDNVNIAKPTTDDTPTDEDILQEPKKRSSSARRRSRRKKREASLNKGKVEEHNDVVTIPVKEDVKDALVVNAMLEEHSEDIIISPKKEQTHIGVVDEKQITKHKSDVASPKKDEIKNKSTAKENLAEHGSILKSLARKHEQEEPTDRKPVEEHKDDIELPKEDKSARNEGLEKHGSDVESSKKEQEKDDSICQETGYKSRDDVSTDKKPVEEHPGDIESPKEDESTGNKGSRGHESNVELPTKKQERDEPICQETRHESRDNVSIYTEPVEEHADDIESPNEDESSGNKESRGHEGNVELPTKKQREDEPICPETGYDSRDDVSIDTQPVKEHPDYIESPNEDESTGNEELEKHESNVELSTKEQEKGKLVGQETGDESSDDVSIGKGPAKEHTDDIKLPKEEKSTGYEELGKHGNDAELPTKKPEKDEPITQETKDNSRDHVPTDGEPLEKHTDDIKSPKEDESTGNKKLEEHESNVQSSIREQVKGKIISQETGDESSEDVSTGKGTAKEHTDDIKLPKGGESTSYEELEEHGSNVESSKKIHEKDETTEDESRDDVESSTKKQTDKSDKLEENKSNTLLDKEFFQYVLNGYFKDCFVRVTECKGGDEFSIQPSYMCDVKKFTLTGYKEMKNFRFDVIVKQLHSKKHQELYQSHIAAKNEEIVYNTIFLHFNVYNDKTFPVPRCFFATNQMIILQDLCGLEYKTFDKKKGYITQTECIYTLQALAKFHSASIVLKNKNGDAFNSIKNLTMDVLYDTDSKLLHYQHESLQGILSIYKKREKSEENAKKIKALQNLIKVAQDDIKGLLHTKEENYVLCHGDLQLTNFLFKRYNKKKEETVDLEEMDVKLIDFQRVHYCSVASDLVYLFFINLQPDDYIENRDYLLARYLFYLKKNIKDCGVTVDPNLTMEWLLQEIHRFTEYGIIYALWIIPMFAGEDSKIHETEVTKEMLEESLKYTFYNERMEKWVDYYCTIIKED